MTRTPDEIYKDIEATAKGRERLGRGSTPAEHLSIAESLLATFQRERDLWNELAGALIKRPSATRETWMVAAVWAASLNATEGVFRAEERLVGLRSRIAKNAPAHPA